MSGSSRAVLAGLLTLIVALGSEAAGSPAAPNPLTGCDGYHYVVLIDAQTGDVNCTVGALAADNISSAAADGHGGFFLGGNFPKFGPVLHLDGNSNVEAAFHARLSLPDGVVITRLVRHGSVLYAGWRSGVAAFDANTGARLWRTTTVGFDADFTGYCGGICGIAYRNGVLYTVGIFKRIGGVARRGVAALDARTGRTLGWTVGFDRSGEVVAVAVGPSGTVYLGGVFNQLGGRVRHNLAAVSGLTGRATSWSPPAFRGTDAVDHVVVVGGEVVVTGGHLRPAAFSASTGRSFAWPAKVHGGIAELAVSGSTLYFGGDALAFFDQVAGRTANNLAAVRLPGGTFTSWLPNVSTVVYVNALAVSGRTVLAAGLFGPNNTPGG